MYKYLLCLLVVFNGYTIGAQIKIERETTPNNLQNKEAVTSNLLPNTSRRNLKNSNNGTAALGTILFTETFGAGLAGDGSNGAWTTNGNVSGAASTAAIWEYRGPNTTPDNSIGSRGAWAGTGDPINAATVANGFFIFDSDYLDNGGSETGAGLGAAPAPHESWLISPLFSTLGATDMVIDFTTYFRRFAGNVYVLLSNDGGLTWGDSLMVFDTRFGINNATSNPLIINSRVNHLANSATARIAFYFDGVTADNSANGLGYYFAMIDDVTIQETPDNDLSFDSQFYESTFDSPLKNYYTMVPSMLADMDTIMFSAKISNHGSTTQPNTKITNNISTPNGTMSLSSNPVNVASGATDSLVIATPFILDQGIGLYSWAFEVSSDSTDDVPSNNTADTVFVEVTDTTYARDYNSSGGFSFVSGSPYETGNMFEIADSVKATSISVMVCEASTPGEPISVYLYTYDETPTDIVTTLISSSEFHVLKAADIDSGIAVGYAIPEVVLPPGKYLATYKTYGTNVCFGQSDFVADPFTSFVDVGGTGEFGWIDYTTPVRLNVTSDLWICDLTVSVVHTSLCSVVALVSGGMPPYTYLWSTGDTTQELSSMNWGENYNLTVTDYSSCQAVGSAYCISSVSETELIGEIQVFPNPSQGSFILNMNGVLDGEYHLEIQNMLGQVLYEDKLFIQGDYQESFELADMPRGIYLLKISNSKNENRVIKLLVE